MSSYSELFFWYLILSLLLALPVVFALWTWVVSLGALIRQYRRNEVLSLKYIHLLLIPLTTLAVYFCYVLSMESGFMGDSAVGGKCLVATVGLVICPYAGLMFYRYYQVKRPLKYLPGDDLFLLKSPGGIAHAIGAVALGVALILTIFGAEFGPKRLLIHAAKTDNMNLVRLLVDSMLVT